MVSMVRLILCTAAIAMAVPTQAEVRFGENVRIGGHDFSHQTFNARKRGVIYLHKTRPAREGCVWKSDGKGGRVKLCHLKDRN